MNKNTFLTIGIIIFALLIVMLGCIPKILKESEKKASAIVKTNCKRVLQDVVNIKDINKLEEISKEYVSKYNETYKNPFTNKETAFTTDKKCLGCVSLSYDKDTKSLNITGYGKNLEILCRTIVKPPSFVTYEREEK